jgi:endonuclease III
MAVKIDWAQAMRPLLKRYEHKKHPLDHSNIYQLLVMVVLSAQSTDDAVNKLAPKLFADIPNMETLEKFTPQMLFPYLSGIRNFAHKATWLVGIAQKIGTNKAIPLSLEALTELPGIGRKSANVILREAGAPPEGVIVDLHVVRVAPRLGIVNATEEDPKKIEQTLMKILPKDEWDAGMAMSFLGREVCRPKPECERCLMNTVCAYYRKLVAGGSMGAAKVAGKQAAKVSTASAAKPGKKVVSKAGKPKTVKGKPRALVNKKAPK